MREVGRDVYLTPQRIAHLLGTSAAAVAAWIDMGQLRAERSTAGRALVQPSALRAFLIAHAMPVPFSVLGAKSLLIIDDDANILRSTARRLKGVAPDLRIEIAEGAREGLAMLDSARPDAVVVDAYMPIMNGIEVCRQIKSRPETTHIVVVAITGDSSPELGTAFQRAGAVAFLEKPVDVKVLFDALSRDIEGVGE